MTTSPTRLVPLDEYDEQDSSGEKTAEVLATVPETGANSEKNTAETAGHFFGIEAVREIMRCSSLTAIRQITHCGDIRLEDMAGKSGPIYGHRMALILLAGAAMRITFKIFYNSEIPRSIILANTSKNPKNLTDRLIADSIKEFCNVTAGSAKRSMESIQVNLGLSLPLSTRGFDEAFTVHRNTAQEVIDNWTLRSNLGDFVCNTTIQILDAKFVQALDWKPEAETQNSTEDDMEFL